MALMLGLSLRLSGAAVVEGVSDPTDASLNSIAANGWQADYTSPPAEFDPVSDKKFLRVTRAGFNSSGGAITFNKDLIVTKRTRTAGTTSLSSTGAAMSDYVFSTDTTSITNNSTLAAPKPIACWGTPDGDMLEEGSTDHPIRLFVAHAYGKSGTPVAAVTFSITDGTSTNTTTVSSLTTKAYTASGLSVPYYEFDLSDHVSGLDEGVLTIDATIYPHEGASFTISTDADSYPSPNLTVLKVCNNIDGGYGRAYAWVSTSGNDGTGAVNETRATAQSNPYATIAAAAAALVTYNTSNFSRSNAAGGVVVFENGTYNIENLNGITTSADCPLVLEGNSAANKANVIFRDNGSTTLNRSADHMKFKDMTLQRNANSTVLVDSAATGASTDHIKVFSNCAMALTAGNTSAIWIYRPGRVFMEECSGLFRNVTQTFSANLAKMPIIVGCSGEVRDDCYSVLGTLGTGDSQFGGYAGTSNRPATVGQVLAYSYLQNTSQQQVVSLGALAANDRGYAIVGNVIEQSGGTTAPAVSLYADSNILTVLNAVFVGNTVVGARMNWLYNDTGTAAISKYGWCVGNYIYEMNTKSDLFPTENANRIGNWSQVYRVWHQYNSLGIGAQNGSTPGANVWMGEVRGIGENGGSSGTPLDADFTDDASSTAAGGDGSGNGDYTPGASNGLATVPGTHVHYSIDQSGASVPTDGTAVAGALQE